MDNTREKLIIEQAGCFASLLKEILEKENESAERSFIGNEVPLVNQLASNVWISVKERLPDVIDTYLVVVKCKYDWEKECEIGVDVATYDPYCENTIIDGCWITYNDWNEGQDFLHVTHWMPLPEPPKGE